MTPYMADSFVDMIGVNAHTGYGYGGSADTSVSNSYRRLDWIPLLKWLGIRYVRDQASYTGDALTRAVAVDAQMSALGIRTLRICGNDTIATTLTTAGYAQPIAVEGVNELDLTNASWNNYIVAAQPTLYSIIKAKWPTGTTVLSPSLGNANHYTGATPVDAGSVDANSCHMYTTPGVQAQVNTGSTPTKQTDYSKWQTLAPGKPIWVTEHGFVHGNAADPAVWLDERAAASLIGGNMLYFFAAQTDSGITTYPLTTGGFGGVVKTFLYELLDEHVTPTYTSSSSQDRFGLFTATGSPKASATWLRNTIALLSDPGAAFTPTPLTLTLTSGGATNISYLLFQKRNGDYWVAFWSISTTSQYPYGNNTVTPRTGTLQPDVATAAMVFSFGQTFNNVEVYRPMQGPLPIQTATKASTITVRRTIDVQFMRLGNAAPSIVKQPNLLRGFYESRAGV